MVDETESYRRKMIKDINAVASPRKLLEIEHGQVWDTTEMTKDFKAEGFMAPFVVVTRRSDGVKGSLTFQDHPRFYFDFKET